MGTVQRYINLLKIKELANIDSIKSQDSLMGL